jgi:hypothetical protein
MGTDEESQDRKWNLSEVESVAWPSPAGEQRGGVPRGEAHGYELNCYDK